MHSDFRNGNFIVQPGKGIVAVLDWELAHIGDPMRDLGWLMTRSWRFGVPGKPVGGFGEVDDLFAGYEACIGREGRSRGGALLGDLRILLVGGRVPLHGGVLSRWKAETSVERPVIGRRSSECQIDCVNMIIPGWARRPQAGRADPVDTGVAALG